MRRIAAWFVVFVFAGFAGLGHAAPPKAVSLKDAWQNLDEKCGTLAGKDGIYEFAIDEISPQEGKQCVISVGTDVIVFGPNEKGSMLDSPKQYLIVPMERIVLYIRQ